MDDHSGDRGRRLLGAPPVRTAITVPVGVDDLWAALTDPVRLAAWFGTTRGDWHVRTPWRIDFGDGDFFVVTPVRVTDDRLIEFTWSFLGVGPEQHVTWRAEPTSGGARLTVEDADPVRPPAEIEQMRAGWTDFLQRLDGYLRTGRSTRYDWRSDIDGSVDLPPGWDAFEPSLLYRWLPVASDGFRPAWFFVVDADGPRRFPLDDWSVREGTVTFTVQVTERGAGTTAELALHRLADRQRLEFSHQGWRHLGLPDNRAHALRRRFAAAWTAAADCARELARLSVPPG
ncbi:SRPBCC domain-containing protein [Micromonospora aurantiaca]|uniref:SRPBCC family protein n=1 Tax=Micromonospora TaxID=1873 RepID=UPI003787A65C